MGSFARVGSQTKTMLKMGWRVLFATGLSLGLTLGMGATVRAQDQYPRNTPPELKTFLTRLEDAANRHNSDEVIQFYSQEFANSDDLDRSQLSEKLETLWERYGNLNYFTKLESWQQQGDRIVLETTTFITGTRTDNGREMRLKTQMRSRQVLQGEVFISQEILSERTEILMGDNPPEVQFNLPDRVQPGERFNFDAIVKTPLGEELLLGAAIEEEVNGDRYFSSEAFDLELLQAGGLFKQGTAPEESGDRWVSAILISGEGTIIITQRLRVEAAD
ncbi:nuclear transport factor 2 family protein [Spirulina sp. 06S082]|uniref:nuclear transport factor 2 family protein n=1 Tax=Spirulina sp. 06S082 TaxID=3110248 RepID=UPI002B2070B9|nr:nuclear transport factor 2 family protein [Spirulina sp. 06S082]MEA5470958.1 nuclear transport factor 2 family protein [Spirulina sp. 06S082]